MLPTTYDALFAQYAPSVPRTFMRALAKRESDFNPNNASGPAWGLMQIVESVRNSYNKRFGTAYARNDLLNPQVNVAMAGDLLRNIVRGYSKHPDRNMREDWSNPEFVKLVLAGWNSGYSEGGGVGKIASWLEARGIPVTHDAVFHYAPSAAPNTAYLFTDAKRRWQAGVADLYFSTGGPGLFRASTFLYAGAMVGIIYLGFRVLKR